MEWSLALDVVLRMTEELEKKRVRPTAVRGSFALESVLKET